MKEYDDIIMFEQDSSSKKKSCSSKDNSCSSKKKSCSSKENSCSSKDNSCSSKENSCSSKENSCSSKKKSCSSKDNCDENSSLIKQIKPNYSINSNHSVTKLEIEGMNCSSCATTIQNFLKDKKGIVNIFLSYISRIAEITHDPMLINSEEVKDLVAKCGYEAKVISLTTSEMEFIVEGLNHSQLKNTLSQSLSSDKGITKINMNGDLLSISYNPQKVGVRKMMEQIEKLGFKVSVKPKIKKEDPNSQELRKYLKFFLISVLLGIPILVMAIMKWTSTKALLERQIYRILNVEVLISFIVCVPAQFYLGRIFHIPAFRALRNKTVNMDVLVSMGTWAAFGYSFIALIIGLSRSTFKSSLYFEAPVELITFILLGRVLESFAQGKTSEAITKLMELQNPTAHLMLINKETKLEEINFNNVEEKEIDTNILEKGDILKVLPGERIPIDGTVLQGSTSIDESMITGESFPVNKKIGDKVIGSSVNQDGYIFIKVTAVGSETVLSQMIKLMENAQSEKPEIQKLADKISSIFVPSVILLALATFVIWIVLTYTGVVPVSWIPEGYNKFLLSLTFAITILVIACPCSLGLASPTAIMVASGIAAKNGFLVKNGAVFQSAHKVNVVLFDKTGTLTHGKPEVTDFSIYDKDLFKDDLSFFMMLSSAEILSEHVIGKAIVSKAKQFFKKVNQIDLFEEHLKSAKKFKYIVGCGLKCKIEGKNLKIGNRKWMTGSDISNSVEKEAQKLENDGKTVLFVSFDGKLVGIVAVFDTIREESKQVIEYLTNKMNCECHMVTGDNKDTANSIANILGIKNVSSQVLPKDKLEIVKQLQKEGNVVAMVGDGINDSPALIQSDLGISIGSGTDIAIEAADIVLIQSNLINVVTSLALAKATYTRIKLNLLWAFLINAFGITLATGIFFPLLKPFIVPPVIAAIVMPITCLLVIVTSLLLKLFKPPMVTNYISTKTSNGYSKLI